MLKGEWDRWWQTLPALEARESLTLYRVAFLADAGWKVDDRDSYVREWEERAENARALRIPAGRARQGPLHDVSEEIRNLFGWLQTQWGASADANDPGPAGFAGEAVKLR